MSITCTSQRPAAEDVHLANARWRLSGENAGQLSTAGVWGRVTGGGAPIDGDRVDSAVRQRGSAIQRLVLCGDVAPVQRPVDAPAPQRVPSLSGTGGRVLTLISEAVRAELCAADPRLRRNERTRFAGHQATTPGSHPSPDPFVSRRTSEEPMSFT